MITPSGNSLNLTYCKDRRQALRSRLVAHFAEQFRVGEEPGQRGIFLVLPSFPAECAGAVWPQGDGHAVWHAEYCLFSFGPYAGAGVEEVDDSWQGLNGGSDRLRGGGGVPFSDLEFQLCLEGLYLFFKGRHVPLLG